MVILVALGTPAGARPSQNAAAEDWMGNEDGNPFLSNLHSNKLRFVRESALDQESVPPTEELPSDQAPLLSQPETTVAFPPYPPTDELPSAPAVPQSVQPESSYDNVAYTINPTSVPDETTQETVDTDASDDVVDAGEETISEAVSKLAGTENSGPHVSDNGSCLIAVIFQAIKVPEDTLEKLEEQNPDLHESENEIWQQLLDMMALDFITVSDDDDEKEYDEDYYEDEEEYDEEYYEYYEDYYYDCEEGTECDDDTVPVTEEFKVMSFPSMVT